MNLRIKIGLDSYFVLLCIEVLIQSACHAQVDAPNHLSQLLHDWDSIATKGQMQPSTQYIDSADLRSLILEELEIMNRAEENPALLSYLSNAIATALYVVRVSERRNHAGDFDSAYSKDNRIVRGYKPDRPGYVSWIIGKPDGTVELIQPSKVKNDISLTKIPCGSNVLDEIIGSSSGEYLPLNSAVSFADLVSIWAPHVKKHFYIDFLRQLIQANDDSEVPNGLRSIAWIVSKHQCQK